MENLKNGSENLRMEEKNKITDLINDALEEEDCEFQINFLIGGMMCEECNDSIEKIKKNQEWLREIAEFCENYKGDKKKFLNHIKDNIENFLPVLEGEIKTLENE